MGLGKAPHWRAPTTIIAALICGVIFAVAHHIFYRSLDGTPAPSDVYNILGSNVSIQQLNIAGGTAFALLFKTSLDVALSAIFIQLLWRVITQRSRGLTLESLDSIFDVLTNVFTLFKAQVWWRYPLLFLVALTAWLIPLASVVTPATLSVVSKIAVETSQQRVPSIDFRNLNYVTNMPPGTQQNDGEPVEYRYAGPSRAVQSIVEFVTANGELVPASPLHANSSWTQEFHGPTLECTPMGLPLQTIVKQNIARAIFEQRDSCNSWSFLAWTGIAGSSNASLPFVKVGNGTWALDIVSSDPTGFEAQPRNPFELYMVSMPEALSTYQTGSHAVSEVCVNLDSPVATIGGIADVIFSNATMTQCQIHNTTYEMTFNYVNGAQDVTSNIVSTDERPLEPIERVFGPADLGIEGTRYADSNCSVLNRGTDKYGEANGCEFDPSILNTLSYQAVAQAFFDRLVGTVYAERSGTAATLNTSVANTILVNTPELNHITRPLPGTEGRSAGSLQAAALSTNGTLYTGLYKNLTQSLTPLRPLMEKLFEYSVVSMISSSILQPDSISAFAPPLADVKVRTSYNAYAYSSLKLWLAYGIALLITFVFVVVGMWAILVTRSSYSLDFSSLFRASRGATISTAIIPEDLNARDPLPPYLRKTTVRFPHADDMKKSSTKPMKANEAAWLLPERQDTTYNGSQAQRSATVRTV